MSLAVTATRSAAWMVAAGLITRLAGVVGTLLLVRHVSPAEYGEAIVAAIVIGTASTCSSLGIGQFVIVKAGGRRDLAFHATAYQMALGVVALALVWLLKDPLAASLNAPGLGRYLPAMAVSMLLDRFWFVPERTLMREMRFRTVALTRSAGDLSYTAVSLGLALLGWGGMAIAVANVARSAVKAAITIPAVDRRDWLAPCRLRRDVTLAMLDFGLPLALAAIAAYAAGKWDNLLVSRFFGPAVMAAYNIAYNLSGMVAGLVVEQIVDILVPSFVQTKGTRRDEGFVRGAALVALVGTPMCFGVAAVSPTLVRTVFDVRWAAVGPMLAILAIGATLGPTVGLISAYLQASGRARRAMATQLVAVASILAAVGTLGRFGPLWACAGVGVGNTVCAFVAAALVRSLSGIPVTRFMATQVRPLLACAPMFGAVLFVRAVLPRFGLGVGHASLAAEIVAGAVGYCGFAPLFQREVTRDFVGLLRAAFIERRSAPVHAAAIDDSAGLNS